MNRNQSSGSVTVDTRKGIDLFQRKVGQVELAEVSQAQRGIIRAVRMGKPGANYLADQVMPLKRVLNDREWQAHAKLFDIELRSVA